MDVELLKRTPSSYLGSCRYKLPDVNEDSKVYDKIFEILKKLEVEYFFYIGENDSMDTIMKLSKYATSIGSNIRFMGVPKTIDNDLEATDHTPGYGSAAKYIAATTKELIRDSLVYDQKNLTIIEIMGRNVGWLTAAAALSKGDDCEGPDMIYLPELAFDMDNFMEKLRQVQKEKKSVVIAISEGIHLADGRYVCELVDRATYTDNFGHTILSGSGNYLANKVSAEFGCKVRAIELNTIQRSASHLASLVDINEAFLVGSAAVEAAIAGETGKMIILKRISTSPYQCITDVYDINKIANLEKKIPAGWISEDGISVTEDFMEYARPLILGELTPYMVDGLPKHLVYRKKD